MSADVNAHMGSATDPNRPSPHVYDTSLCCKTYELCWDSEDNDGDGFIDCADRDCWGGTPPFNIGVYGAEPQICTGSDFDTANCTVDRDTIDQRCQGDDGNYYHCSYGYWDEFNVTGPGGLPDIDPASQVGVCCPEYMYGFWDAISNSWGCRAKQTCFDESFGNCKYTFQLDPNPIYASYFDRDAWLASTEDGKGALYNNDVCNFDNFIEDPDMPRELQPDWRGKSTGCCLIEKHGVTDYYYYPSNIEIFGYAE